jgi:hypothetical protein
MKTLVLFLFSIFSLIRVGSAQTVFAPKGAVWHYEFNFDGNGANYRYEAEKDTLYHGVICSKVIGQRKNTTGIISLPPNYFYTSVDTVFYYNDSLKNFTPLYIFNVKVGDTLTLFPPKKHPSSPAIAKFLVTKLDTTIVDGIPLRSVYTKQIDLYYYLPKYTERIGGYSVANIIAIDAIKTAMHYETIRCYRDNFIEEQFLKDKWDCDYVSNNIDEQSLSKSVHIYPNPAYKSINVHLNTAFAKGQLLLMSLEGKVIFQKTITSSENLIDISHLMDGFYILQVKNELELFSQKIIVSQKF